MKFIAYLLRAVLFTTILALLIGINNIRNSPALWAFLAAIFFARSAEIFSPAANQLKKYKKDEDQSRWTTLVIALSFLTNAILPILEYRYGLGNLATFFVGKYDHQAPPPEWWNWLGVLLLAAGSALRLWAIHQAGASFLPHVKADPKLKLITGGPYVYVRHPSYLGTFCSYLGIAIIFSSLIGAIALLVMVTPAMILRIAKEEQLLANRHGEGWRKYQSGTPWRLIPGLW
jgi:protein-S-isoprenylcysteine O-methyltransferase Ste14